MIDKERRIRDLESQILNAKKSYYSLSEENDFDEIQLLDAQYDALESELKKLDPDNKVLKQVGIEETYSKFEQVNHKIPMKSMEKIHYKDELVKWFENILQIVSGENTEVIVEPKIDGCSGDLYYKNGKFQFGSTRGNGKVGFKINTNLMQFIPKEISDKNDIHVRGEFVIFKSYNTRFEKLEDMKSLRSLCSGALKHLSNDPIQKEVVFVAYQLYGSNFTKESEKIDWLKKNNFYTVPYIILHSPEEIWKYYESYVNKIRDSWEYETDGIVLEFNSEIIQKLIEKELGSVDHHNKYALAIKPPAKGAWTFLREVEWNTSKDGRVVPTGIVTPVRIGEKVYSRASLNNSSYIKVFDIKLNDEVYLISANDIIPKILQSKHTPQSVEIKIDTCPSCGAKLVEDSVYMMCPNTLNCPAQKVKMFVHWFSSAGIKNLGESALDALVSKGNFTSLWQLYAMSTLDLLKVIEKYVGISADTETMQDFGKQFEESRSMSEFDIITNYGIPGLGKKKAEALKIFSFEDLTAYLSRKSFDSVLEEKISQWLSIDNNYDNLYLLFQKMTPTKYKIDNRKKIKFCITGKFNHNRDTIIKMITDTFDTFEFESSVNKFTDLLIRGEEGAISNKEITASKYKIPIIRFDDGVLDLDKIKDIKI